MSVLLQHKLAGVKAALPLAELVEMVYASVPAMECKGLCADTCDDPIPLSDLEWEHFVQRGLIHRIGIHEGEGCPFLWEDRCSIYAERPFVCRMHGTVDLRLAQLGIPLWECPHGCRPERPMGLAELVTATEALIRDRGELHFLNPQAEREMADLRAHGYKVTGGRRTEAGVEFTLEAP